MELHKICILKRTGSKEELLFGLKEFLYMKFEWYDN